MYARLFIIGCLVVLGSACLRVDQAAAQGCTVGIRQLTQGAQPQDPIFAQVPVTASAANNWQGWRYIHVFVESKPDPHTGIKNTAAQYDRWPGKQGIPGVQTGDCLKFGANEDGWGKITLGDPASVASWPPANGDGFFYIHMDYNDGSSDGPNGDGWIFTKVQIAWVVGGVWTMSDPNASPPDQDPYGSGSSSGQSLGPGSLIVKVTHTGTAAAGYVVTLSGENANKTTSLDGIVSYPSLSPQSYQLTVTGSHTNTDNTITSDKASRLVFIPSKSAITVSVAFDAAGVPTINGGEDTSTAGTGNWLLDILRSAFIPSTGAVTNVKSKLGAFVNWGPLQLVGQLVAMKDLPTGTQVQIGIPIIALNPSAVPGPHGANTPGWEGTSGSIPLTDGGLTQTPLWATLRLFMGLGIWFTFVFGLAKTFMPKKVV